MRNRLLFSALAFIALAIAAHFLHSSADVSPHAEATSPKATAPNSTTTDPNLNVIGNGNRNINRPEPKRESASAPAKTSPSPEFAALNDLQAHSTRTWTLKRDDFSNQIRTLSGGELSSKSFPAKQASDEFIKTYSQNLFGVDPERVKFTREDVTDRTRVIYNQVIDGVPVYGAALSLFFENGLLTRVQNDLIPLEIDPSSKPSQVGDAFSSYKSAQASLYDVSLQKHESNRVILFPNGRALVYAYEFVTSEIAKTEASDAKSFHVVYDADEKFVIQRRPSAIR